MNIQIILWESIEIETTDNKKKKTWSCKNAAFTVVANGGTCNIKEYDRGSFNEGCQSLVFGSTEIKTLTPFCMSATGIAFYSRFYKNGKTRTILRPVRIVANF